jgi:Pro-kumamolisin, activation domain
MKVLRTAYRAQLVYLCALFLTLLFSIESLVSCNQPAPPQYSSLNLGIPAAALQSPLKGPLPDTTKLHIGITFKVDPKVLNIVGQRPLQPGQSSNLEQFARRLGIDDATYQKIKDFFNAKGLVMQLSKLRTYMSVDTKAGTLARLMQTTFVIHQYKGRTFYAPKTPPKVPTFLPIPLLQSQDWITIASLPSMRSISAFHKHHAYLSMQRSIVVQLIRR